VFSLSSFQFSVAQKSETGLGMMHGFISQTRSPLPLARKEIV
jgi:hypothetical protein